MVYKYKRSKVGNVHVTVTGLALSDWGELGGEMVDLFVDLVGFVGKDHTPSGSTCTSLTSSPTFFNKSVKYESMNKLEYKAVLEHSGHLQVGFLCS